MTVSKLVFFALFAGYNGFVITGCLRNMFRNHFSERQERIIAVVSTLIWYGLFLLLVVYE